jgi:hypothetical protein
MKCTKNFALTPFRMVYFVQASIVTKSSVLSSNSTPSSRASFTKNSPSCPINMQRAGAGLRSIAEPVVDTTSDFAELVLAMLGVAAKLERRRIMERTARRRADAKAKGVRFGRKPKLTPHQAREAQQRLAAGETQRSIARSYNVSQATISRLSA